MVKRLLDFDECSIFIIEECLLDPKGRVDLGYTLSKRLGINIRIIKSFITNLYDCGYLSITSGEMWPTEKGLDFLFSHKPELKISDNERSVMFSDIPTANEMGLP